jgi:CRISPR-associated protein Cas6
MPERFAAKDKADGSGNAVDIAFELQGKSLAGDYSFALMREIARCLPWIESEPEAGIHSLRAAKTDAGDLLLPRRAKLVLRLPERRIEESTALCGQAITVRDHRMMVGAAKVRRLVPIGTLYAHLVTAADDDEQKFLRDIASRLQALQTPCELVCGKRRTLHTGSEDIVGYSLMLHGLAHEHSVLVQRVGLGDKRMHGCGIFVGHKSVVAVG